MWRFLASAFCLLFMGSAHAAEPLLRFASETGEHLDFNAGNLQDAEWVQDSLNGSRILRFRLDQKGAELLGDFTLRLINRPMKLFICSDLVAEAVVREPVTGGVLSVNAGTPDRAKMLADKLKQGDC
jgi:preprotein translocase subunit SecD